MTALLNILASNAIIASNVETMLATAPVSNVSDVPSKERMLQTISRSSISVDKESNYAAASVYLAPFAESIAYLVFTFKSANVARAVKSSAETSVAT